jgi:hypothetical protein
MAPKILEIALALNVGLFFLGYFSISLFLVLFTSSLDVFAINLWSITTFVLQCSYPIILEI